MADVNHLEKIPAHYNKEIIRLWIKGEKMQVAREILNPSNYCVVVLNVSDTSVEWTFYRFFVSNGKTQVSVDWRGSINDALDKLIENYSEEHNH